MVRKIIFLLFSAGCLWPIYAQSDNLALRLEITKDTVFIGEPMVIKCVLINRGTEVCKVYGAPSDPLLSCGVLDFILSIPNRFEEYQYRVCVSVLVNSPPSFILEPQDSFYWFSILNWRNWTYTSKKFDYLRDLPIGYYQIKAIYFLASEDLTRRWQITSNIDSFYTIKMPARELKIFREIRNSIDDILGFCAPTEPNKQSRKIFRKFMNVKNSIIAQFCHYLLAYSSTLPERIDICESFLERYPNTPLAEEIEFWLARAYVGIGREDISKDAYRRALEKYPDNIKGYYYRNLKRKIKE